MLLRIEPIEMATSPSLAQKGSVYVLALLHMLLNDVLECFGISLIGFRETSPSWVVKRTNGFVSKKPLGGMLLLLKFAPGVFVQVETVVHRYCIVRLATLSASFTCL